MVQTLSPTAAAADGDEVEVEPPYRRAFLRWGGGAYLVTTAVLLAVSLHKSQGRLVYLIDDPAIHLSLANNLLHSGTWGPAPGHFQSASSSPAWTVLMTGFLGFATLAHWAGLPRWYDAGPLVFNLAASFWVIAIFGSQQRVLLPSRRRPLDALAVIALVVVVLFLPALTMLGMEHILDTALVLSAVILFSRRAEGRPLGWPSWTPYVVLGLATLVRFETLFVAAGLGLAYLAQAIPGWTAPDETRRFATQVRKAVGVGLAAAVPFLAFASFNRLMGQGWLPNSVLAKGQGVSGTNSGAFTLTSILNRFTTDPLLAAMTVLVLGALAWGRGRHRWSFMGITFVTAVAIHVTLAQVGWYERYQAYLVALGALTLVAVADDVLPALRRAPRRAFLAPSLVLMALLLCGTKISLTNKVPLAVSDTYQQRYQAGLFLAKYYDGQPVATGELGYISLKHKGPITDLFGLGDYDVLQARRAADQHPSKAYWAQLAHDRGFKVAAVYPSTLLFNTPDNWILVGEWHTDHDPVTALEPVFQFWATTPEEEPLLKQHLQEFAKQLPPGATLSLNPLADYRAAVLRGK